MNFLIQITQSNNFILWYQRNEKQYLLRKKIDLLLIDFDQMHLHRFACLYVNISKSCKVFPLLVSTDIWCIQTEDVNPCIRLTFRSGGFMFSRTRTRNQIDSQLGLKCYEK